MATTSGTVSTYPFNMQRVIDHACRRAGRLPQRIGAENQQIAKDLIFTLTSQWINAGFPLWTRQYLLLGTQVGSPTVTLPDGVVEVLHSYWRILQPYRGAAETTGSADATALLAGAPTTDVTIAGPNPGIIIPFGSATQVNTIGVVGGAGADVTGQLAVYASDDGVTYTLMQTLASATFSEGQWTYADLNPTVEAAYVKIVLVQSGSWTVQQFNIGLSNWQDIENGKLNIDDYYNLTNRYFQSDRPNSYFQDRPIGSPVLMIWPTLNLSGWYAGTVTALARRYIQDPGVLTNNVEVPQRWLEALIWRLAVLILFEFEDDEGADAQTLSVRMQAKQARLTLLEAQATKAEALAWSEERNISPIRLLPSLHPYTA